jgi:CDP-paratose 2-epimerase
MRVLVTGSNGLIGSEAVRYYDGEGHEVFGIDNNMRAVFFGPAGDTSWNLRHLKESTRNFTHHDIDIRDRDRLTRLFEAKRPSLRDPLLGLRCECGRDLEPARDGASL